MPTVSPNQAGTSSATRRTGTVVDRFTLARPLPEGPFGPEFLATETGTGRTVRLWFPGELLAHAGADRTRDALREMKASAGVRHDGLLRTLAVGRHEGTIYVATEHCDDPTAADLLDGHGPLPPAEALRVARAVAESLVPAHAAGLTHRDLRPENLHVAGDGTVRVARLGLVRAVEELQQLRVMGMPIASPHSATPETYRGAPADARTDVYALGATLHRLLTGRPAFEADTSMQILHKHASAAPPDPRDLVADLPAGCCRIVLRAMAKDPAGRFPDMTAMAAELGAVLAELPVASPAAATVKDEPPVESPTKGRTTRSASGNGARSPSSGNGARSPTSSDVRAPVAAGSGVMRTASASGRYGVNRDGAAPVAAVSAGGSARRAWVLTAGVVAVSAVVAAVVLLSKGGDPAAATDGATAKSGKQPVVPTPAVPANPDPPDDDPTDPTDPVDPVDPVAKQPAVPNVDDITDPLGLEFARLAEEAYAAARSMDALRRERAVRALRAFQARHADAAEPARRKYAEGAGAVAAQVGRRSDEGSIPDPEAGPLWLLFETAIRDGCDKGDGVRFVVTAIEGRRSRVLYECLVNRREWVPHAIPLTGFAGKRPTLQFQVEPQKSTDCDWGALAEPRIVRYGDGPEPRVVADLLRMFPNATTGRINRGKFAPLSHGGRVDLLDGRDGRDPISAGGKSKAGLYMHPVHEGGQKDAVLVRWVVDLPAK